MLLVVICSTVSILGMHLSLEDEQEGPCAIKSPGTGLGKPQHGAELM